MEDFVDRLMQNPIQLGTLLSFCSGIVLAVIGFVHVRVQDRKRYTFDFLMRYSHNPELLKALHHLSTHAATSKEELRIDDGLAEDLAITLPHFSAIALASKGGLLDNKIILAARYASMRSVWTAYGPYLLAQRVKLGRPLLYVDVEEFLKRNAGRYAQYERSLRTAESASINSPESASALKRY